MKKSDRLGGLNCRRVQSLDSNGMVARYRPLLASVNTPNGNKKRLSDGLTTIHGNSIRGGLYSRPKIQRGLDLHLTNSLTLNKKLNFNSTELSTKINSFEWTSYLKDVGAEPVQSTLFHHIPFTVQVPSQSTPAGQHAIPVGNFIPGYYLEGIDPHNESLFCVLSVVEFIGRRVKLHFTGYPEKYDFWVSVDSPFIFSVGWCAHNGRQLQPPKECLDQLTPSFNWTNFLTKTGARSVSRHLFKTQWDCFVNSTPSHLFEIGMKLEAVDKRNPALACVATIKDCIGDYVLIHFDGWDFGFDQWAHISSELLHYVGYCDNHNQILSIPSDWSNRRDGFNWKQYLKETNSKSVPKEAFEKASKFAKPSRQFLIHQRLEAVDKRCPSIIRVANIVDNSPPGFLTIGYDGWPSKYNIRIETASFDLFSVGYCHASGHTLQVPPEYDSDLESNGHSLLMDTYSNSSTGSLNGLNISNAINNTLGGCPTPGCKGYGHIKGPRYYSHQRISGCPYADGNLKKDAIRAHERLNSTNIIVISNSKNSNILEMNQAIDIASTNSLDLNFHNLQSGHRLSPDSTVKNEVFIPSLSTNTSMAINNNHNGNNSSSNSRSTSISSGNHTLNINGNDDNSNNHNNHNDEDDDVDDEEDDDDDVDDDLDDTSSVNHFSQSFPSFVNHSKEDNVDGNKHNHDSLSSSNGQIKFKSIHNSAYATVINNLFVPTCPKTTLSFEPNFLVSCSSSGQNETSPLNLSLDRDDNFTESILLDVVKVSSKDLVLNSNDHKLYDRSNGGSIYSNHSNEFDHETTSNNVDSKILGKHPLIRSSNSNDDQDCMHHLSKAPKLNKSKDFMLDSEHNNMSTIYANQTPSSTISSSLLLANPSVGDYDKTYLSIATLPVKRKRGRPRKYTSVHMFHSSSNSSSSNNNTTTTTTTTTNTTTTTTTTTSNNGSSNTTNSTLFTNYSQSNLSYGLPNLGGRHSFPIGLNDTYTHLMCSSIGNPISTNNPAVVSVAIPTSTVNSTSLSLICTNSSPDLINPSKIIYPNELGGICDIKHLMNNLCQSVPSPSESIATSACFSPNPEMDISKLSTNSTITTTSNIATNLFPSSLSFVNQESHSLMGLHFPNVTLNGAPNMPQTVLTNPLDTTTNLSGSGGWFSDSVNRNLMSLNPMCFSAPQFVSDLNHLTNCIMPPPFDFLSSCSTSTSSNLSLPPPTSSLDLSTLPMIIGTNFKDIDLMGRLLPQAGAALRAAKIAGLPGPHLWNPNMVANFVATLPGCKQFANTFIENEIDGAALLCLEQHDLMQILGMKLGPAVKVSSAIQTMRKSLLATPWSELGSDHHNAMQAAASCFDNPSSGLGLDNGSSTSSLSHVSTLPSNDYLQTMSSNPNDSSSAPSSLFSPCPPHVTSISSTCNSDEQTSLNK